MNSEKNRPNPRHDLVTRPMGSIASLAASTTRCDAASGDRVRLAGALRRNENVLWL